ncbi:hypothetical protein [Phenylobacterium sp.]|uniref:hypothetical protein n=1 Tax=Phenylobacterium sp. TaxID=1871053 RepID=UPI0030F41438
MDDLVKLSVHDRHQLFKNAVRLSHTPDGAALKTLIEEAGLPFSEGAMLSSDDPAYVKMYDIVHSPEGRAAAIAAVKSGLPGLAGVEPMIHEVLGIDYGPHNWGTVIAGSLVGEIMHSAGYRKTGSKPMPPGSVAKTAATWK